MLFFAPPASFLAGRFFLVLGPAAARAEDPALASVLDPLIERRYDPVRIILRRAIERGQLPKGTDVELAVHMIMDITAARLYFTSSGTSQPAIREVFRVLLKGLGARGT